MSVFPKLLLGWEVTNRHTRAFIFKLTSPSDTGKHIVDVSTRHPSMLPVVKAAGIKPSSQEACDLVGELLAGKAKELQLGVLHINRRKPYVYHGRVKALLESLKQNGLTVH
jgi:ribosomal protein L18